MRSIHYKNRLKNLNKTVSKQIMLILVVTITVGLLISSLLFNYGYTLFTKQLQVAEKQIDGAFTWGNVFFTPYGTLFVKDLNIYRNNSASQLTPEDEQFQDQTDSDNNPQIQPDVQNQPQQLRRRAIFISKTELSLNPLVFLRLLFVSFDNLIEHDQAMLKRINSKKSIAYMISKSIDTVLLAKIKTNINLEKDTELLKFVQNLLFKKQIIPTNATIAIEDIDLYIQHPLANMYSNKLQVKFNLSDVNGIKTNYSGHLFLSKFNQNMGINVVGDALTTDFFKSSIVSATIENSLINNVFSLTPMKIDLESKNGNVAWITKFLQSKASVVGSYFDSELLATLDLNDSLINDIVSIKDDSGMFKDFLNDKISGGGKISYNSQTRVMNYYLKVDSHLSTIKDSHQNNINIDILGDQNNINIKSLNIILQNQFIKANGILSLLNYGITGNLAFNIDKPFINFPISSSFSFNNTPFVSVGISNNLLINGKKQLPLKLEFSYPEKYFSLKLGNNPQPIIIIKQNPTNTNYLETQIHSFPLDPINDIFNNTVSSLLVDILIDGSIDLKYNNNTQNPLIDYKIKGRNPYNINDYLLYEGYYRDNTFTINKGEFHSELLNNTSGTITGSLTLAKSSLEKNSADITLQLSDGTQHTQNYDIKMNTNVNNDSYIITVNDNVNIDIDFESSYLRDFNNLKAIKITSNEFNIPFIKYSLNGSTSVHFNNTLITNANTNLLITDISNKKNSFLIQANFEDNEGVFSNLVLINNDRSFKGVGNVKYNPNTHIIKTSFIETPDLNATKTKVQTTETLNSQSVNIDFDFKFKNIRTKAKNFKIGLLTNAISGIINTDFLINYNNSSVTGKLDSSQIVYENNKFNLQGDFFLNDYKKPTSVLLTNASVIHEKNQLDFKEVVISENSITSDFTLQSLNNDNETRGLFDGTLLINLKQNIFSTNIKDPNLIPEFNGALLLEPIFTSDALLLSKYRYSIQFSNLSNVIYIIEKDKNINIQYNMHSDYLSGQIGTSQSLINANLSGVINLNDINIDIVLNKYDMGKLNTEFIQNTAFITLDNLLLKGKISLRDRLYNPIVYGYINIENFEGYSFFFNKILYLPSANILISNNEISLANSFIQVDNDRLLINAQGRLNRLKLENLQIDVSSMTNKFFKPKTLHIGGLVINGEIKSQISVFFDKNSINVTGDVVLQNALISNEGVTKKQLETFNKNKQNSNDSNVVTSEIKTTVLSGVVFAWPTNSFSILRANFARGQQLEINYDSEVKEFVTIGDIAFNGGTYYYFNKGFDIEEIQVKLNDLYTLKNPYIEKFAAKAHERYQGQNYELILTASTSLLQEMPVNISAVPPLSNGDISQLFGQNITPDTTDTVTVDQNESYTQGILSTVIKLSDPITNLGVFSRIENVLQRTLKVDYLSFRTKFVQNLLSYSIISNANVNNADNTLNKVNISGDQVLPYLFDQSTFEIGKYIDIIYLNLQIEFDADSLLNKENQDFRNDNIFFPVNTSFNVELPTPFFDLTWSLDPSLFKSENRFVPVNLLTISWSKKF